MPTIEAFPSGPIKSCVDFNRDGKIDLIATVIEPESAGQNNSSVTLFLNRADRANAIRGRLWNDLNKNQVFDLNESPIGGRYVWPDQDDNGVSTFESDPQGVFTDADGTYELFVPNGTSIIRQLLPAGWVQTDRFSSPGFKPTAYNISISGLAVTSGWDFGSYYLGTVSGRVFNDYNANRSLDPVESGLAGWRVFSDTNGNSTYEVGEPTAVSNASGDYQISNVFPRAVKVRIVKPAGYEFTQPVSIAGADAFYDANVYGGFPGANTDVGLINPALVSGRVFNDINADGIVQAGENGLPSIFVAIDYNGVSVLLGLGDGTFADAVNYAAVVSTYGVAVADFNNDNNLDIVAAGPFDTRFALLTGTGDGTFSPAVLFDTEFGGLSIAAGDTNADGKRDVVIANRDDSSISIHRGNGIGTFAPRIRTTSGIVQPTFVTLADVNADSRLDLVYLNEPSNRVAVRLANGTGGFAGAKLFATTASPQQVAVIDVDRDGKLDLVVAGRSDGGTDISGGVSILRGNGDETFQS